MLNQEKVAHELALLYMQAEIKDGQISTVTEDDMQDFVDEYKYYRDKFKELLDAEPTAEG